MRIVIAGGAGFIGSHLCDYLLERSHEIVAVDNFLTGCADNTAQMAGEPRFSLVRHDVTRPLTLPGRVDWVLNLASPASPVDYLEHGLETLEAGSQGTKNLLELAAEKGARFLQASTSECYGDPEVHPQTEVYWGNVNPIGPRSVYDESKRYAEALTMAYHRYRRANTRIARIFNTYGPRMKLRDGRVVPNLIGQALSGEKLTVFGDGSQTRSFCYVTDLVEGLARVMDCDDPMPINLGNPEEISILEFARRIEQLTGSTAGIEFRPLPQDDPKKRCPDISRARRLLGWEPAIHLEEGLPPTLEYFRAKISAGHGVTSTR